MDATLGDPGYGNRSSHIKKIAVLHPNPYEAPTDANSNSRIHSSIRWAASQFQILAFTFLLCSGLMVGFIAVDAEMRSRGVPPELPSFVWIFDDGYLAMGLVLFTGLFATILLLLVLATIHRIKTRFLPTEGSDDSDSPQVDRVATKLVN